MSSPKRKAPALTGALATTKTSTTDTLPNRHGTFDDLDRDSTRRLLLWSAMVDGAGPHRWTESDEIAFRSLVDRCERRGRGEAA